MTIYGMCFVGDKITEFSLRFEVPLKIAEAIIVAVNPADQKEVFSAASRQEVTSFTWQYKRETYDLLFALPEVKEGEIHIQSVEEWRSTSRGSDSLYPWWINMPSIGMDVICQIHPKGCSSEHYHKREVGVEVSEVYLPIINDGCTLLHLEGSCPVPLKEETVILPGQAHRLIRREEGFSMQLLIMCSWQYRFQNKDGHCPCNRLSY